MSVLRVGLAGAGFASDFHLAAWHRISQASVVAICDPNIERARRQAAKFDVPAVYETLDELFSREAPDALDIATPRETHTDLVRKAHSARTPTLCQKPLAPSLADAVKLATDIGPEFRLMVHENWRFRPHYRRIKGWIDQGLTGSVRHVSLTTRSSALLPDESGLRPALQRQPFMKHRSEERRVGKECRSRWSPYH